MSFFITNHILRYLEFQVIFFSKMLQGRNENTNKLAISGLIEIFLKIVSLLEISVRV